MGSYYGEKVDELVGLYLLNKLAPLIGTKNVAFWRDDGLAVIHQVNGLKMDRVRRDITVLFKSEILFITIDTNVIETDFLDVSFNIEIAKCFLYREPNNTPHHFHSESHHPPSTPEQLLSMTNWRIANLYCDENEFNKSKPLYISPLKNSLSEFNYGMKFEAPVENTKQTKTKQ